MLLRTWRNLLNFCFLFFLLCFLSTFAYSQTYITYRADPLPWDQINPLILNQGKETRLILKTAVLEDKSLNAFNLNITYDHCYFIAGLTVTGKVLDILDQTAYVEFGLVEAGLAEVIINPDNWSEDYIVRLQLIDAHAEDIDITDSNTFTEDHYLVKDIREPSGEPEIAWYVMVEMNEEGNPNASDYWPILSWDTNDFGCQEVNGNENDYRLIRGLGNSGIVLVDNMADTNSYQTCSQDGGLIKYFTILGPRNPEKREDEKDEVLPQKTTKKILPWPGVFPRALGWSGFSLSGGGPGGLPYKARSGYPPGLSIPSFPGTYTGFTYPGGMYRAWTSFVPRFPLTFPVLGIFSPVGQGWHSNYWTGYPLPSSHQTGWFYAY